MINLIYASTNSYPFSEDELLSLLETSHENNAERNITGMLVYGNGDFLQVIEGEEDQINTLFNIIKQDHRHKNITLIAKTHITQRTFTDWKMGFIHLDHITEQTLPDFSECLNIRLNSKRITDNPDYALRFLKAFKLAMVG